jgi:hypothetical protein
MFDMKKWTRRCSRCGAVKLAAEFAGRPGVKVDTYCRPCRSAYGKEHYAANRQRYIEMEAKRKRARAEKRATGPELEKPPCGD